jgi:hypothetical protein
MPFQRVQLAKPYYNVDSTSLISNCELVQDGYIDEFNAFHKRAGYKLFCDLGTNSDVMGVYFSSDQKNLIAVSNGRTFKITDRYGAKTDITGDTLPIDQRVQFNEFKYGGVNYLFMVANSSPMFTNYTANTQTLSASSTPPLSSGSVPTNVTHMIEFYSYLICNKKDDISWRYSFPGNPFSWAISDSYNMVGQHNVKGIFKGANNFLVCSNDNIDIWSQSRDILNPYLSSVKAQYAQIGLASPYASVVIDGTRMIFLDKTRRLVMLQGTSYVDMGLPINNEIQNLSTVEDAVAFNIVINGKNFLVLNFPSDKKTFVYDYISQAFYKWSSWDETTSTRSLFRANCYTYASTWNKHIIGDISNGKLFELDTDSHSDDGNTINAEIITGHINYGSDGLLKQPKKVIARIRRGDGKEGSVTDSPRILIRHRDQNESWSNFKEVQLGPIGDTNFRAILYNSCKPYYSRQYHIKMPDNAKFVLSSIEEEF